MHAGKYGRINWFVIFGKWNTRMGIWEMKGYKRNGFVGWSHGRETDSH